jgi:hypothetical protein
MSDNRPTYLKGKDLIALTRRDLRTFNNQAIVDRITNILNTKLEEINDWLKKNKDNPNFENMKSFHSEIKLVLKEILDQYNNQGLRATPPGSRATPPGSRAITRTRTRTRTRGSSRTNSRSSSRGSSRIRTRTRGSSRTNSRSSSRGSSRISSRTRTRKRGRK